MEPENADTETPLTNAGEGFETKGRENAELGGEGLVKSEVENVEGEQFEGEHTEEEQLKGEHIEGEHTEGEERPEVIGEGEELAGEELEGEQVEAEEKKDEQKLEEQLEEEEYVEPPPPDPAAPFDFSDSSEAIKPKFELRPEQTAEVEQLWEVFQNYTPAYTDIHEYITEKELVYMLKALLLMTYTPEQLQELIAFCVRPPHPQGHINYDQFLKMVTLRQRDFPIEEELRAALKVLDPDNAGTIDREYFKEILAKQGHKMPPKNLENLVKEVDISNDGTIGIEDVIGTMCIDLNKEDLMMLRAAIFPEEQPVEDTEV
ncbi:uncharacterized protein LOC120623741 [Pararge aegeria]|uniref:Jg11180 protein n=1 Tax=Pararge aegeria aegeria TaxID=348720 RepID=A0A8S4RIX3_9NEOP|nr:uncharacterized protein LOC120623741 [Pararge aegeria]CAH2237207.1 jg11180 [Pararge aegeria aegeria]